MNKNEQGQGKRTGLMCRAVRRWEGAFGGGAELTRVTERHLEVCDECQAFFAEDFSFEEMMRGEARAEKRAGAVVPDDGFEMRILRAVREGRPETAGVRRRASRPWSIGLSLAGAAAGVALAFVVSQQTEQPPVGVELVNAHETEGTVVDGEVVAEAASTAMRWWATLDTQSSALELAARNPLQREIESVSSDAKSLIDFLALNFLPTTEGARVESGNDRG